MYGHTPTGSMPPTHVVIGTTERQREWLQRKATRLGIKPEIWDQLQKLSDKTGAPVSELIRRGVQAYLKERAKELK